MVTQRRTAGFSLAELLIVLFIVGILTAIAVPQYTKTVESTKADEAASTVSMISTANRLWAVQNGNNYTSGQLTDTCYDYCCANDTGACSLPQGKAAASSACNLLACKYLAAQAFNSKPYNYYAVNAASSATDPCGLSAPANFYSSCAKRKTGAAPGTSNTNYTGWGYAVDKDGGVVTYGGAPKAPPLGS
ncbi:MAG: prepilin-type N-terminal cleavage/methylation domain-containing protein [Elusimicrobia bacterium]|nr:prepilin-type N-terminal cleavage/methylation domain-containing protein [Elusimicrobiota bacterium]